jgi:hypothetical protein
MVCDQCQGELHLVTSVAPFGRLPGAHFYQCRSCGHLHIKDLSAPLLSGSDGLSVPSEGA